MRRAVRAMFPAVVALTASWGAVRADDAPVPLDPLQVTAPAEPQPEAVRDNPSRFVEVVPAEEAVERGATAADLVEDATGAHVRRQGSLGSFSTVSVRGASPSQVPVLLDGVPLADARWGVVSLDDLPTTDLERVEVYRGFAPLSLGESGIGGAVNLVTRAAPDDGGVALSSGLGGGSFGTWRGWVRGTGAPGGCDDAHRASPGCPGIAAAFSVLRSDGRFAYRSDGGTPDEPTDDRDRVRENNDYSQAAASLRLRLPGEAWSADGSAVYVATDQGLPGLDYDPALEARLAGHDLRIRIGAAAERLAEGRVRLETGLTGRLRADRFDDPAGEIGVGRQREEGLGWGVGGFLFVEGMPGDGSHRVRGRLDLQQERFRASWRLPEPAEGPEQARWRVQLGAEYEGSFADDAWVVVGGARLDVPVDLFAGDPRLPGFVPEPEARRVDVSLSPTAGVRWSPLDGLSLKANLGWLHRTPTFAELFGDRGAVQGNPELARESALVVDLGAGWAGELRSIGLAWQIDAAGFAAFAEDLIVFLPQSQAVFRAENVGSARTLGVEAALRLRWRDHLEGTLRYTFLQARDTGDTPYWNGQRLPGRPPHDLTFRLQGGWGPWRAWTEVDWLAETPLDRANLRFVPGRWLQAVGLGVRIRGAGPEMSAAVEVRNLWNAAAFDAFRYPLPGRTFQASFALHW